MQVELDTITNQNALQEVRRRSSTQNSRNKFIFGLTKKKSNLSKYEWGFWLATLTTLITLFVFNYIIMADLYIAIVKKSVNHTSGDTGDFELTENKADFTFCLLLLCTLVFGVFHCSIGVWCERPHDLLIFAATSLISVIYVTVNFASSLNTTVTNEQIRFYFTIIACPLLSFCALKMAFKYRQEEYFLFKEIGGNLHLRKRVRLVLLVDCLLHFDLQLGGSTLIFCLSSVFDDFPPIDEIIGAAALGMSLTITWFLLGFYTIRKESKVLLVMFNMFGLQAPVLIFFVLFVPPLPNIPHVGLKWVLHCFGVAFMFVRATTHYYMWSMSKNFGKGIKDKSNCLPSNLMIQHLYRSLWKHE